MKLPMGTRELEIGGPYLDTRLRDCNAILHDSAALRARMEEDGYLLVRGLHQREKVWQARKVMVDALAEQGQLRPDADPMDAYIQPGAKGLFAGGRKGVSHHPAMLAILEGEPIRQFFRAYFGQDALTFNYKWLRAIGRGDSTGAHYDVVYMGRGSQRLTTVWTPLGDVPLESGTLALIPGSHRLPGYEKLRQTYGRMDVDRDKIGGGGWFSTDPVEIIERFGGQWQTTDFQAGDVILFGMYTMHASTLNTTDRFRISTDTRFQPAADSVDERWIGDSPKGHYAWGKEPGRELPLAEARKQWGV